MTIQELAGWAVLATPAVITGAGLVAALLLRYWSPAYDLAAGGADYIQAVREAVELAEGYGASALMAVTGADKLAVAIKRMDDWLDERGVHGDARRVTLDRVRADIELMRVRLFPSGRR